MSEQEEDVASTGISRRTVTKAMAWAVPAVAVVAAVPLASASPTCLSDSVCFGGVTINKYCGGSVPGGREYWACVCFTNKSKADVTVTFSFSLVTDANGTFNFSGTLSVPAGGSTVCKLVEVYKNTDGNTISNCSHGTYSAFDLAFSDGTNSGVAHVPGGSTTGNTPPSC